MAYSSYNFGVEIETVVRTYARRPDFRSAQEWYKQLAQRLENRNVAAAPDLNSRYSTHPEYYSTKWFITRDGSLQRAHEEFVAMEIVSPVLNTSNGVTKTLSEFWEAMSVGFEVQKEDSCGGHVHVTPTNSLKRFSLIELQKCAFAAIVAENLVHSILPACRKNNRYCAVNSKSGGGGWARTAIGGVTNASIKIAQREIQQTSSLTALHSYMQGSRYVLWNFANIIPQRANTTCSGTLEFRGGSQFLDAKTTLKWVAFVVAFIHLALEENLLQAADILFVATTDPGFDAHMLGWWKKIRKSAAKLKVMRYLPETWKEMRV